MATRTKAADTEPVKGAEETAAKLALAEEKLAQMEAQITRLTAAMEGEKARADAAEDKAQQIAAMQRSAEAQVRRAGMRPAQERRVRVMVPVSDQNPQDTDIPVIVNGRTTLIRRGEEVEVPASVAEVLQHSVKQANACARVQAQFMYIEK